MQVRTFTFSLSLFMYYIILSLTHSLCCSAKRLISASIEMPKTVELLDLSYNDITNIDADCFEVSRTICHGNKVVKSSIKKYI